MLMIRLRPVGKKGQRSYQLIINENAKDVFGDYLEKLGHYDPNPTPSVIVLKEERNKYWLSKGAQASDTVHNLLVDAGLVKGEKIKKGNTNRGKKKEGEETKEGAEGKEAKPAEEKPKEEKSEPAQEKKPKEETKPEAKKPEKVAEEAPKAETEPKAEVKNVEKKPG